MCRTNVVAGAEDSFDHESRSHRVVQPKVLRNPIKLQTTSKIEKICYSFKSQKLNEKKKYFFDPVVLLLGLPLESVLTSR